MKPLRRWMLAGVVGAGVALVAPRALAFGIGFEASATSTSPGQGLWGPTGGILVENVIPLGVGFLDPWADVQLPVQFDTQAAQPARYLSIDLGLRLGLAVAIAQPYFGVLGQMNVLLNTAEGQGGSSDNVLWGIGGDLGVDFVVSIVRLGLELRGLVIPGFVPGGDFGRGAGEGQALLSARLSF